MEIDLRRRLPLVVLCFVLASIGVIESMAHLQLTGPGWDAAAYWDAWRGSMYDGSVGDPGHYLYSPAFAQVVWPLAHTTWPVFASVLIAVNGIGLAWLLRPLPITLAVPLWLAGSQEVLSGNIFIPMAVVAVLGMRTPALWSFVALTKITPALGPVWFAARGEWSAVLKAALATAAVVLVSASMAPDLWQQWFGFLVDQARLSGGAVGYEFLPGPAYRLPVALALVVWGARTDRVWVIPVAMVVASPFIWNGTLTLLAAIPRLRAAERRAAPRGPAAGPPGQLPSSTSAPTG
nr:glycosyltransferase 87 family protein [uncultured Nocardioides sp.]